MLLQLFRWFVNTSPAPWFGRDLEIQRWRKLTEMTFVPIYKSINRRTRWLFAFAKFETKSGPYSVRYTRLDRNKADQDSCPQIYINSPWCKIVNGPLRLLKQTHRFSPNSHWINIRKSCGLVAPTRVAPKLWSSVFNQATSLCIGTSLISFNPTTSILLLWSSLLLCTYELSILSCVDIQPVMVSLPPSRTKSSASRILG